MPRLTKIYTRTGDDGLTSLGTKHRVAKDTNRVCAYGDVDELNSQLGLALSYGLSEQVANVIQQIQHELFNLGAELAFPSEPDNQFEIPRVKAAHIKKLEEEIDRYNEVLGPLENFILPGGTIGAAQLQVARAVCRRAERSVVTLARNEPIGDYPIAYLNRLSDALFVIARFENYKRGIAEPTWDTKS